MSLRLWLTRFCSACTLSFSLHKDDAIFTLPSVAYLFYLTLVAITTFLSFYYVDAPEGYWLIWSAMIFLLLTLKDTLHRRLRLIVQTWLMTMAAVVLTGLCSRLMPLLLVYLFCLTAFCTYLGYRILKYRFAAFIVNLFAILPLSASMPVHVTLDQLLYITIGVAIVFIGQGLYVLCIRGNENREWQVITLNHLEKLNDEIFSCLLQPDYISHLYLYERRLHVQKHKVQVAMDRLRKLNYQTDINQFIERKLERVYEILMDCSQLRFRVSDGSTLSLCSRELQAISNEIDLCFDNMMNMIKNNKKKPIQHSLSLQIVALEDHYQSVLMVAAPDPLVFLLFIASLKALSEEIS